MRGAVSDEVTFIANLCNRQSALMLSGDGQRCLVELEAFGVNASQALRMAIFAGMDVQVTVTKLTKTLTELDVETGKKAERRNSKVGRGRT